MILSSIPLPPVPPPPTRAVSLSASSTSTSLQQYRATAVEVTMSTFSSNRLDFSASAASAIHRRPQRQSQQWHYTRPSASSLRAGVGPRTPPGSPSSAPAPSSTPPPPQPTTVVRVQNVPLKVSDGELLALFRPLQLAPDAVTLMRRCGDNAFFAFASLGSALRATQLVSVGGGDDNGGGTAPHLMLCGKRVFVSVSSVEEMRALLEAMLTAATVTKKTTPMETRRRNNANNNRVQHQRQRQSQPQQESEKRMSISSLEDGELYSPSQWTSRATASSSSSPRSPSPPPFRVSSDSNGNDIKLEESGGGGGGHALAQRPPSSTSSSSTAFLNTRPLPPPRQSASGYSSSMSTNSLYHLLHHGDYRQHHSDDAHPRLQNGSNAAGRDLGIINACGTYDNVDGADDDVKPSPTVATTETGAITRGLCPRKRRRLESVIVASTTHDNEDQLEVPATSSSIKRPRRAFSASLPPSAIGAGGPHKHRGQRCDAVDDAVDYDDEHFSDANDDYANDPSRRERFVRSVESFAAWADDSATSSSSAAAVLPMDARLRVNFCSVECEMEWRLPDALDVYKQRASVKNLRSLREHSSILYQRETTQKAHLKPGVSYQLSVRAIDEAGRLVAHGEVEVKATFSIPEMRQLLERALALTTEFMEPVTHLHRCKPRAYWDEIYERDPLERIMHPYLKDNNGHPASPINHRLCGLFFSPSRALARGITAFSSPFGNTRMRIEAHRLLDHRRVNLYFADFYCNSDRVHYVTVTVCRKGSESDRFCSERLVPLDPLNNRFVKVIPGNGQGDADGSPPRTEDIYLVAGTTAIRVELYYTEAVSLFAADVFDRVATIGRGVSFTDGLPHNDECAQCNLYAPKSPPSPSARERRRTTSGSHHQHWRRGGGDGADIGGEEAEELMATEQEPRRSRSRSGGGYRND